MSKGYLAAIGDAVAEMEEASQEGFVRPFIVLKMYLRLNDTINALIWLEKGYEMHDPGMPYITTRIAHFDKLENNPRYIEVIDKMNLSLK